MLNKHSIFFWIGKRLTAAAWLEREAGREGKCVTSLRLERRREYRLRQNRLGRLRPPRGRGFEGTLPSISGQDGPGGLKGAQLRLKPTGAGRDWRRRGYLTCLNRPGCLGAEWCRGPRRRLEYRGASAGEKTLYHSGRHAGTGGDRRSGWRRHRCNLGRRKPGSRHQVIAPQYYGFEAIRQFAANEECPFVRVRGQLRCSVNSYYRTGLRLTSTV